MSYFRCISLQTTRCLCSMLMLSPSAFASDDTAIGPPASVGVEVQFNEVVSASQMINAKVRDADGEMIGTVADVVLDTEFGELAFIAVRNMEKVAKIDNVFFLPPNCLETWNDDDGLTANITRQQIADRRSKAKTLQPSLVVPSKLTQIYEQFDAKLY